MNKVHRVISLFAFIAMAIIFAGCDSGTSKAKLEKLALDFVQAMINEDYKKVEKLSAKNIPEEHVQGWGSRYKKAAKNLYLKVGEAAGMPDGSAIVEIMIVHNKSKQIFNRVHVFLTYDYTLDKWIVYNYTSGN